MVSVGKAWKLKVCLADAWHLKSEKGEECSDCRTVGTVSSVDRTPNFSAGVAGSSLLFPP